MPRDAAADPVARAVFVALIVACFAAFFITQHLKHTPTAVQTFKLTPRFSPFPTGHIKQEGISFKLAQADEATVTVINSKGQTVATLMRARHVPRYKQLSLRWNGRTGPPHGYGEIKTISGRSILVPKNRGKPAPPGEYRVRVSLAHRTQPVLSPRSFTLVAG